MKNRILSVLICFTGLIGMAQTKITLTVGGRTMTATLADNEATKELEERPLSSGLYMINGKKTLIR